MRTFLLLDERRQKVTYQITILLIQTDSLRGKDKKEKNKKNEAFLP
jgi:hypothetical protein